MALRILNTILLLATFLLGSNYEITIFENAGISAEIILLFFTFFINTLFIKNVKNSQFRKSFLYCLLILVLLLSFLIRDLLFANYRTFYSLIFFLLLYSIITIKNQQPFFFDHLIIVLLLFLMAKALFFPEVLDEFDYLDSVDGRTYRLRILGFESNAVGVIFCSIFVYSYSRYIDTNSRIEKIIFLVCIFLSVFLLIKTFGRASYLSLIFSIFFLFYKQFKFYLLIIPLLTGVIIILYSKDLLSPLIVERLFSSFETNNPRVNNWVFALNDFKNNFPLSFLFGIGFFKHAIDNTYLNIFISIGLVGFTLFFIFFNRMIKSCVTNKHSKIILFIILFNFLFVDFFAQRKILLIAFFLIASLEIKHKYSKS